MEEPTQKQNKNKKILMNSSFKQNIQNSKHSYIVNSIIIILLY